MFGPSLNVGVVNVILKVFVLLFVALIGESAAATLKLMFSFRLRSQGNAPLIFENDGQLLALRDTMRRLCRVSYSGALAIALLCAAIFPVEMVTDFGVDVSDKCRPERLSTLGICPTKMQVRSSWDKALLTSFQVEDAPWNNNMLVANPIRQGFRKNFEGDEYFGDEVDRNTSLPVVIANCTVTKPKTLPVDGTTLHFSSSPVPRSDGIRLVKIVARNGSTFSGKGMLTNNNVFHSSFLVMQQQGHVNESTVIALLEYPYSDHVAEIEQEMSFPNASKTLTTPVRFPVISYNLSCAVAGILPSVFTDAIYGYRFAQLARSGKRKQLSTAKISVGPRKFKIPEQISPSDVVRAVIASKISEVISCPGETFVYTSCGWYDFSFGIPLVVIGVIIMLPAIWFRLRACFSRKWAKFPVTFKSWSKFAFRNLVVEQGYIHTNSEEYKKKYKRYGKRSEMGEFYVDEDGGNEFHLRRIEFGGMDDPELPVEQGLDESSKLLI